jgi:predicted nucleic acid-binding protein
LSFDIDGVLRRLKPEKKRKALLARRTNLLNWVEDATPAGGPILLDTTVYIDVLYGRSPAAVEELLRVRTCHHSAVCLAEMTHLFGRLDPLNPRTRSVLAKIGDMLRSIPPHRLHAPREEAWAAAGILGGMLFRLASFQAGSERKCLNDALIYLQARDLGIAVVTSNRKDFDYLNQLMPEGRILLYHRSD